MDNGLALFKVIAMSSIAILALIFFFAYKVDACKDKPAVCHDEFHEIKEGYSSPRCDPGATMETVSSPKPGVICHCKGNDAGL